jgi:hypothetical protein
MFIYSRIWDLQGVSLTYSAFNASDHLQLQLRQAEFYNIAAGQRNYLLGGVHQHRTWT